MQPFPWTFQASQKPNQTLRRQTESSRRLTELSLYWCTSSTAAPPGSVPSDRFTAARPFVPEVRRAPHPLCPLLHVQPSLHILWHRLQVTHRRPRRQGWSQARCASKRVDLDAGPEVHEGHAHGRLLVPLTGESLGFLLLLQLIQNFQEKGAKQARHFLHLRLVDLHDLPEPEQQETGSETSSKRALLQREKEPQRGAQTWTLQKNINKRNKCHEME